MMSRGIHRRERRHPNPPPRIHPRLPIAQPPNPPNIIENAILQHWSLISPCGAHCFVGRPVSDVVNLLLSPVPRMRLANFSARLGNARSRAHIGHTGAPVSVGTLPSFKNLDSPPRHSFSSPLTQRSALHSFVDFFSAKRSNGAVEERSHPWCCGTSSSWLASLTLLAEVMYFLELGP